MVAVWYALDDAGRFIYRRGVVRRMKGWGKDPFLAALSYAEMCGPVRFGGWDDNGFPIGVQHPMPLIQIAAVSKEQTQNTMTLFPGMTSLDFKKQFEIDMGKEIIYARGGKGKIQAVTSSPRTIEGARPSLVVMNETHHWIANNEGLAMADVIRRNIGKSRDGSARSIEITNAHLPGEGSVAEGTYKAVSEGDIAGVWYDSLEAPAVVDIHNYEEVTNAIKVARGESYWVDPDRLYDEIQDPLTAEYVAKRYYFNQVVLVDIDRWLPQGVWATLRSQNDYHIGDHDRVVMGFDGSLNGDATAMVLVTVDRPKPFIQLWGLWERPHKAVDWRVPRLAVMDAIRRACGKYTVVEIAVDPKLWQSDLEILMDEGYPVVEFPQRGQEMIEATQRLYEDITRARCEHDGNENLTRHIANAWVKDPLQPRIQKESQSSRMWVDAAVAMVMAAQRAKFHGMESQYATVLTSSDYRPESEPIVGMQPPKVLTEKDYLIPNQFQ
jgi:phage terminase large subunit-like protein